MARENVVVVRFTDGSTARQALSTLKSGRISAPVGMAGGC
jgi:hypothetical protein